MNRFLHIDKIKSCNGHREKMEVCCPVTFVNIEKIMVFLCENSENKWKYLQDVVFFLWKYTELLDPPPPPPPPHSI